MPRIPLDGNDWYFGKVTQKSVGETYDLDEVQEWLPATVPGNLLADLRTGGVLPDPYFGENLESCHWVGGFDWWYRRSFVRPECAGKRVHLVLNGVDYISTVYVNGKKLGSREGMFGRQLYELTGILGESNELAIRIKGANSHPRPALNTLERAFRYLGKKLGNLELFPARLGTVRCQMSAGWDFAPPNPGGGIWDSVFLDVSGSVYILDVAISTEFLEGRAEGSATIEVDSSSESSLSATAIVEGIGFEFKQSYKQTIDLVEGKSCQKVDIAIPEPRLWEPWDQGSPNLYNLTVVLEDDKGVVDAQEVRFGIRTVSLEKASVDGIPWTLMVNGRSEFIRGANWVPADFLYGTVGREDYKELIGLARSANINLLRVWGGGLREKKAFYDLCDEEGILVWQEFPFACSFFDHYPKKQEFISLAEAECREIVKAIRNHPSLVMWCGGNEINPGHHKALIAMMERVVKELDRERPFKPASPSRGDSHNWRVWHGGGNVAEYRDERTQVLSEFGLQSPPEIDSLKRFLPPEDVAESGRAWEYHNAELKKLQRYNAVRNPGDTEEFIDAAQRVQAVGLQTAIEHQRRRRPYATGVLFWQFNEPWPAISWSVVDYYRRPKIAYLAVQKAYNPILVSILYPFRTYDQGDRFEGEVWIVNDRQINLINCRLELLVGNVVVHGQDVDVASACSNKVGKAIFRLPCQGPLIVRLWDQGKLLSENLYDLTYFDSAHVSLRGAVTSWLTRKALE